MPSHPAPATASFALAAFLLHVLGDGPGEEHGRQLAEEADHVTPIGMRHLPLQYLLDVRRERLAPSPGAADELPME